MQRHFLAALFVVSMRSLGTKVQIATLTLQGFIPKNAGLQA
jgi:hypothetical protein